MSNKEIPSNITRILDVLKEELKETNSWVLKSEEDLKKLYEKRNEIDESILFQNKHIDNFKRLSERQAKKIQELKNKYLID